MALQQLQDLYLATTVTPGEKPAAGQLQLGELAFNAADRLGFLGTGNGAYYEFPLGGGVLACGGRRRHPWPCGPSDAAAWRHLGGHHARRTSPPELKLWNGTGWVVLAKPDGVTVIANPATGVLQAERRLTWGFSDAAAKLGAIPPIAPAVALITQQLRTTTATKIPDGLEPGQIAFNLANGWMMVGVGGTDILINGAAVAGYSGPLTIFGVNNVAVPAKPAAGKGYEIFRLEDQPPAASDCDLQRCR